MGMTFFLSVGDETVCDANITHNLAAMADQAGIYFPLWRPKEVGITKASQVADAIRAGLADMKARPSHYAQFDASNGWGTYSDFMLWASKVYDACMEFPDATVQAIR